MWHDYDMGPPYSVVEKGVCRECNPSPALDSLVEENIGDWHCSYCEEGRAAPIEVLQAAVLEAIAYKHTDPANVLPYESREGGYQGVVKDGDELVWDMFEWHTATVRQEAVVIDIAESFACTDWCEREYFGVDEYQALSYGWQEFSEVVKHRKRYLFGDVDDAEEHRNPMEIPPSRMLDALGNLLESFGLFSDFPTDVDLFRARIHPADQAYDRAVDLGPPPRERAGWSNRMSPAGIPMFYGSLDPRTAVAETFDPKLADRTVSIGRFRGSRPLRVVDLTDLPNPPSPLDAERRHLRDPLLFLRGFVNDLTRPVERDGSEHIEYVPTQIVTEYARHSLSNRLGRLDGLLYQSSREEGDRSVVLFFESNDIGPRDREAWETNPTLILQDAETCDVADYGVTAGRAP